MALLAPAFAARPATPERTVGYQRWEIFAAAINALFLFGVAAYVLIEAVRRFTDPRGVSSGLMLAVATVATVATVGPVANAGSLLLLRGGRGTPHLRHRHPSRPGFT